MFDTLTGIATLGPQMPRKKLPGIVRDLIAWRKTNRLTRPQAAQIISERAGRISRNVLKTWEVGITQPNDLETTALVQFLKENPKIDNPPQIGPRRTVLPNPVVRKIRNERKHGATLSDLARKYNVSVAAVSLLCSGKRRAKPYDPDLQRRLPKEPDEKN